MLNNCIARDVAEFTKSDKPDIKKVEINMALATYTGQDLHIHTCEIINDRIAHFRPTISHFHIPEDKVAFVSYANDIPPQRIFAKLLSRKP